MPYLANQTVGYRDVDTSIEAAMGIQSTAATVREKVLDAIDKAGFNGMTSEELANLLRIEYGTVQPRTSELKNKGLICDSGIRRKSERTGKNITALDFKKHKLKEPDHRIRYLSSEETERLIENSADHLKLIIRFALMTGARRSNMLSLTWDQVDFQNDLITLHVKSTKQGGRLHTIPLYKGLKNFMHTLNPQNSGYVFTYKGRPIASVKKAFNRACERAGVDNFRFHDLRHTCASWLVQNGVELV